ncbi:MAG: 50S ribosome-binding GTPase [Planctomycetaceae bacterium]|nr:50S ribosome-binding GTPase [Planctomycetaceae bacterium]
MTNTPEFATIDDLVRSVLWLDRSLDMLCPMAVPMGVESPVHSEWYSLLRKKLVPQLSRRSHLVVAVTGGTNTGKSVIFNQLAGEKASAADSHAAGTKHPVCLLPPGCDAGELLRQYFDAFEHCPWQQASDPLEAAPEHRLYWNIGQNVPRRLLLVDTPDVDSDAEVNWERARSIRQVADLLIAVLTSQKYNDAAVKQYFREAVESGKPVLLVWNMAYEDQYRDVWPEWISQFRAETGVSPLAVFATPHNRDAIEAMTLEVRDIGLDGRGVAGEDASMEPRFPVVPLQKYLNEIRFDELKMQALIGALRRVDAENEGVGTYLRQIETAARDFDSAAKTIRDRDRFDIDWPTIPKAMLADEISRWCNSKRSDLLQNVSAAYNTVLRPVQWAWGSFRNRLASNQQKAEQKEELAAVMQLVEKTIDQLKLLGIATSNRVLKDELNRYLGEKRKELLSAGERIHSQIPPKTDAYMRGEVYAILNHWAEENPDQWQKLHKIDVAALGTHAVLSLGALATCGVFGVAAFGSLGVMPLLMTGGIVGGSEALLKILGEEVRMKIAELKVAIQKKYASWRKGIFLERFESELWGEMLRKFDTFSAVARSKEYHGTLQALESVRKIFRQDCLDRQNGTQTQ